MTTLKTCEETNHLQWPQKRFTTMNKMSAVNEELFEHDLSEKIIQMDKELENCVQNSDATDAAEKDSTVVGAAHVAEGHMEKHSSILEDETNKDFLLMLLASEGDMEKDITIDAAGDNLKFWEFQVDKKNHPTMYGAKDSKESHGVTHVDQRYKGELENYGEMYMAGYVQNHSSICEVDTDKETYATMHEAESNMGHKDAINMSGGNMNDNYTMHSGKGHTQTHGTMRAVKGKFMM